MQTPPGSEEVMKRPRERERAKRTRTRMGKDAADEGRSGDGVARTRGKGVLTKSARLTKKIEK